VNRPIREGFQTDQPAAATPAPRIAPPAEKWPIIVPMEYSTFNDPSVPEPIRELRLRQPTGADINACGSPVVMNSDGTRFVINDKSMHMMIARLAGILTPIFDTIDPRDWQTAAWRLYRFFLAGPAAWED